MTALWTKVRAMDKNDLNRYGNYILNSLHFEGEQDSSGQSCMRHLLVEGYTDAVFINNIITASSKCTPVGDLIKAYSKFEQGLNSKPVSFKQIIVHILQALALPDPTYAQFPKGSNKYPLYGMVDSDDDDENSFIRVTRLFFTDKHDIETLMLSSDQKLLTRIEEYPASEESIKKALYLSYQLAYYRKELRKYQNDSFDTRKINEDDGTVRFKDFTEGDYINLDQLLQVINSHQAARIPTAKLNKVRSNVISGLKKKVTSEGQWKKPLATFSIDKHDDFWRITNGHDILSAVRYVDPNIETAFQKQNRFKMDRTYELALSKAYDYRCFVDTTLYKRLFENGLIKDCS